jgi:hypothetical protein
MKDQQERWVVADADRVFDGVKVISVSLSVFLSFCDVVAIYSPITKRSRTSDQVPSTARAGQGPLRPQVTGTRLSQTAGQAEMPVDGI